MATDIFSILVDILKINQALVNQYAVQGPLYQLFYLFFFPILFIVIFIYILARVLMPHRGLRFLLSAAVFAFIVLEGWYSFFVSISKFWLFLTVLLGFVFLVFHKVGGGGAKGKVLGGRSSLIREAILGEREWNPLKIVADQRVYNDEIKIIEAQIKEKEDMLKRAKDPKERNILNADIGSLKGRKGELEEARKKYLKREHIMRTSG